MNQAACKGKTMVYDVLGAHTQRLGLDDLRMEKEALAVCRSCPVIFPCRQWAMSDPDPAFDHVAGGLTPAQRWAIRR